MPCEEQAKDFEARLDALTAKVMQLQRGQLALETRIYELEARTRAYKEGQAYYGPIPPGMGS